VTRGGPPAQGLGKGLTIPHHKKAACYKMLHRASGGLCEHGNEHLVALKGREFLD